jgi:hypothetical protein
MQSIAKTGAKLTDLIEFSRHNPTAPHLGRSAQQPELVSYLEIASGDAQDMKPGRCTREAPRFLKLLPTGQKTLWAV